MTKLRAQITGTGSYLPPRVVTNKELEPLLHTTDEWIRSKIGIHERRYVEDGMATSDLAVEACKKALEAAKKEVGEVDAIIMATSTPDYQSPGAGVLVQHKLNCHRIPAFDVHNTSPGFIFSLELGQSLIRAGKYECVLVVASEVHSRALDMSERGRLMSVIFGDGAGAVVLEPTDGEHGIVDTKLHSDGRDADKLMCEAPGSFFNPWVSEELIKAGRTSPTMDGRFVFENAVKMMSLVSEEILTRNDVLTTDLAHVLPHQANLRIIEAIARHLEIPPRKVHHNIEKYGNTSAASIAILLDEKIRDGTIQAGDLMLMMSFGSGLSWGSALVRY